MAGARVRGPTNNIQTDLLLIYISIQANIQFNNKTERRGIFCTMFCLVAAYRYTNKGTRERGGN